MSKPPPDLGEDSARLYESPGQKTEEMAVQLFRVHYTSITVLKRNILV
jgi:hypothetical protein